MEIPFRLQEGILFEDTGSLLRWGETFDVLKGIDSPETNPDATTIKWEEKKCFGGEVVNVTVATNEYQNENRTLEFVHLEEVQADPWVVYRKYSEYFKSLLGEPTEFNVDSYDRPKALWNLHDLQIIVGVGERFNEFQIFDIHYGKRFWRLNPPEENRK